MSVAGFGAVARRRFVEALEVRQLRYFVAVMEQRGFHLAAQKIRVTQPSLSRQVQQLEEILGVRLLLRLSRGVQPTRAGQVLYEDACAILAILERASIRCRTASANHF